LPSIVTIGWIWTWSSSLLECPLAIGLTVALMPSKIVIVSPGRTGESADIGKDPAQTGRIEEELLQSIP